MNWRFDLPAVRNTQLAWSEVKAILTDFLARILALESHTHDADDIPTLDHGAKLTGLTDDDHAQYLLATGTRDGATSSAQQFVTGTRHGDDSHHADFDNTGHLTFTGNARPWRDALTDALNLQQSGVGVSRNAAESTVDFAYNAIFHATFSSADAMYCNIQLNHDKDLTASIYPHLHWFQAANYSPNMMLEYRWQINGGAKTTSWTKIKCNSLAHTYSSGTIHQISYTDAIAVASWYNPERHSTVSHLPRYRRRIRRFRGDMPIQYRGQPDC